MLLLRVAYLWQRQNAIFYLHLYFFRGSWKEILERGRMADKVFSFGILFLFKKEFHV